MSDACSPSSPTTLLDEPLQRLGTVDDVVQLREWGTRTTYRLPNVPCYGDATLPYGAWFVGTAAESFLRLWDRGVSKVHARLSWDVLGWRIDDLSSRNGLFCDGVRQLTATLAPGMVLRLGGARFIVESHRLIELHKVLRRVLGYSVERRAAVDEALVRVCRARLHGEGIALWGEGDLVPVALELHRRLFDPDRRFVLCSRTAQPALGALVIDDVERALAAAHRGSLCLCRDELPAQVLRVAEHRLAAPSTVQLFLCGTPNHDQLQGLDAAVFIPALSSRPQELPQLVADYVTDAMVTFNVRDARVALGLRAWIIAHAAQSIGDISTAATRLVAISQARSWTEAAGALGVEVALLRAWLERFPVMPGLG